MSKLKLVAELKQLKLSVIDWGKQMVRSESDIDHIHELALSISSVGLINPIAVVKDGMRYTLVAGYHRYFACQSLGWETIACNVLPALAVNEIKSVALVENIARKNMSIEEECKAVAFLVDEQGLSTAQICSTLGKGRDYVLRRQMAGSLPHDVKERLFSKDISLGVAEELGRIEDDKSRAYILWQAVQQRLEISTVRDLARIYLESPTIQEAIEKGEKTFAEISAAKTPQKACDACGQMKDYRELMNIWVCQRGCGPVEETLPAVPEDTGALSDG